jgi:acyl dehydratase
MPSVIAHRQSDLVLNVPGFPAFNPMMLLYGEENLEFFKPITADLKLRVEERIADVADKGKMTGLTEESLIKNAETGETLVKILRTLMIRGVGGYGYKGGAAAVHYPEIPKRDPDAIVESKSQPNQALLYRLNGDLNPLHIDPDMAGLGGFEKPIIHGLCSSGFTARMVYEKYCNGDPTALKKFSTRFLSHVFPGETYIVEIWKDGNTLIFQTKTKERGKVAVRGFAELKEQPKL